MGDSVKTPGGAALAPLTCGITHMLTPCRIRLPSRTIRLIGPLLLPSSPGRERIEVRGGLPGGGIPPARYPSLSPDTASDRFLTSYRTLHRRHLGRFLNQVQDRLFASGSGRHNGRIGTSPSPHSTPSAIHLLSPRPQSRFRPPAS